MNIDNNIELTIVATIYNDGAIVKLFVEEIESIVSTMEINYELILVNDGSVDSSEAEIKKICDTNRKIKGISLSRNFGQQIAMSAGIASANGKFVCIMDGDMQNPPSAIPLLFQKIKENFDIVYTTSKKRNGLLSQICSNFFWFILVNVLRAKIVKHQLMMKVMTREFVQKFNKYNEICRTVSGITNDISSHYAIVDVKNKQRHIGRSKYNFYKRFNLMIDIIINMSNAPLNFMIYFGLIFFILTIITSIYHLINYFISDIEPGYTSIILSIFFFGSLIILMLGLIGRYLSNIGSEVRNRPMYHIKNTFNL